ncbi:hypothetical protein [Planctomycetes bacterium K23_9]|uniref:Arylsulfatase n=1 Tax=Stieleria marina TaxID=1930275 RepID=A0A517NM87_9BACT|nr:hypothetical protein K239x_01810 [Planctomycetes bacterium K23_9]
MTGISPHVSGLYDNRQKMRQRMPDAELLPKHFSNHGYWSAGSGKLLHYFIDADSWDEYYPPKETCDGPSLVLLLNNAEADWPHVSISYLGRSGNYGRSGRRYRYIACDNGDEEVYDIETDRYEWTNLAAKPGFAEKIAELKSHVPDNFAKYEGASIDSLPKLKWIPLNDKKAPASESDSPKFDVHFTNKRGKPVRMFQMNDEGVLKPYGTLETGWSKPACGAPRSRLDDRRFR